MMQGPPAPEKANNSTPRSQGQNQQQANNFVGQQSDGNQQDQQQASIDQEQKATAASQQAQQNARNLLGEQTKQHQPPQPMNTALNLLGQQLNQDAGIPFALVGASPLQQQLSALSGLTAPAPTQSQISQQAPTNSSPPDPSPFQLPLLQIPLAYSPQLFQQMAAPNPSPQMQFPIMTAQGSYNPQQQLQQLMLAQQLLNSTGGNPLAGLAALLGAGMNTAGMVPGMSPTQSAFYPTNPISIATNQFQTPTLGAMIGQPVNAAFSRTPTDVPWAEPFTGTGKGKKDAPFPLKLHKILENPNFQECICWNQHGHSWRILSAPKFERTVIPLYFRHSKYASFMRQVNGWGFKRIVSGTDHNSYYHELFVRDNPQLCLKMKRIRKGESDPTRKGARSESTDIAVALSEGGRPSFVGSPAPLGSVPPSISQLRLPPNVGAAPALSSIQQIVSPPNLVQSPGLGRVSGLSAPNPAFAAASPFAVPLGLGSLGGFTQLAGLAVPTGAQPALAQQMAQEPVPVATATTMPTPAPNGALAGALSGVDSATLAKLQELFAAAGGTAGILQPQTQLPNNVQNQQALSTTALLAAQLQAATQPNQASNGAPSNEDSASKNVTV